VGSAASAPTFAYEFCFAGPGGAAHCIDIPFAFDNLAAEDVEAMTGPDPPQELATAVHRAFVDFAATADPGWQPYQPGRRATMTFDRLPAVRVVRDDPLQFEREIWTAI
jgi:para-nitrobenzyl esterase